jgi:NAD(P)-dependent dehydrogenase (short-subunit alcohol dehydrogenase family)
LTQFLSPFFNQNFSIINISSVHAHATSKNLSSYVATKGAVSALTRSMALELGGAGVRVNSICPGAIETEMLIQGLTRNADPDLAMNNLKKSSPLNKIGSGSDVAKLVSFLLDGELSGNITGQEFVIDSGVLARLASE